MQPSPNATLSAADVHHCMTRSRQSTKCNEAALRRERHTRGIRHQVEVREMTNSRRCPDIAVSALHIAILLDGCSRHPPSKRATSPEQSVEFQCPEIEANITRNRRFCPGHLLKAWTANHASPQKSPDHITSRLVAVVDSRRRTEGSR